MNSKIAPLVNPSVQKQAQERYKITKELLKETKKNPKITNILHEAAYEVIEKVFGSRQKKIMVVRCV